MKDLETNNDRPNREDTDGRPEREPAYKSFMKDKRARITTSKSSEKVEYRRREPSGSGSEYYSGKSSYHSDRPASTGKNYRQDISRSDYRERGEKHYSAGNNNSERNFRSRENGRYDNSSYSKERLPYERKGGNQDSPERRRSYNPNFDSSNRPVSRGDSERQPRGWRGEDSRGDVSGNRGDRYAERKTYANRYENGTQVKTRYGSAGQDRENFNRDKGSYRNGGTVSESKPYRGGGNDSRHVDGGGHSYSSGKRSYGSYRGGSDSYNRNSLQGKPHQDGFGKYPNASSNKFGRKSGRPAPKYDSENYPTFPAPVIEDKIRLNRYIAMSGICSRREADDFIQSGVVTVNGLTITELGAKVSQNDEVRFNGNVIKNEKKVYIVMNKPKGYVTSVEDPHADKTVMELLKNGCRERVYPVGRLDKNSLGVLLITNDGDMAKKLMHPSFEKKKVYQVSLDKPLTRADMDALVQGFDLDDGEIHADAVSYVGDKKTEIGVEIHSGRNRIVRRMFEHLGYKVVKLDRVYFAGLTKQRLKRGEWRFLTPREVQALRSGQYE